MPASAFVMILSSLRPNRRFEPAVALNEDPFQEHLPKLPYPLPAMRPIVALFTFLFTVIVASAQSGTLSLTVNDGVGEDSFVHSAVSTANVNFNTIDALNVYAWTNGGALGVKRAFIKFDLSLVPSNAIVTSAHFSVFYNSDDDIESFNSHTGVNGWTIQRVASDWNPATVTWNNQPPVTNANSVLLPATVTGSEDFADIDVTDMVLDMIATGQSGFRLSLETELAYRGLLLASGEDEDPARWPRLDIEYDQTTSVDGASLQDRYTVHWLNGGDLLVQGTPKDASGTKVEVRDVLGRMVHVVQMTGSTLIIPSMDLVPGRYTVLLWESDRRVVLPVMKLD